jgi:hypothetical protein
MCVLCCLIHLLQDLKVYLIEINSSPAVADALLSTLVADTVSSFIATRCDTRVQLHAQQYFHISSRIVSTLLSITAEHMQHMC